MEKHPNDLEPGSVVNMDSLLMRTRWGNWVSDGGFIVDDETLALDIQDGHAYAILFDIDEVY